MKTYPIQNQSEVATLSISEKIGILLKSKPNFRPKQLKTIAFDHSIS